MTERLANVIDTSNWSGNITPEQAQNLAANEHVEVAINGDQDVNIATEQGGAFLTVANMLLEGYAFMNWDTHDDRRVQQALTVMSNLAVPHPRIWVDCEDTIDPNTQQPVPHTADEKETIKAAVAAILAAGGLPGIYTNPGWWEKYIGDDADFNAWAAQYPLWLAYWVGNPNIPTLEDFHNLPKVGAWPAADTWQYRGSTTLEGVTLDESVRLVDSEVVSVPPPQGVPQTGTGPRFSRVAFGVISDTFSTQSLDDGMITEILAMQDKLDALTQPIMSPFQPPPPTPTDIPPLPVDVPPVATEPPPLPDAPMPGEPSTDPPPVVDTPPVEPPGVPPGVLLPADPTAPTIADVRVVWDNLDPSIKTLGFGPLINALLTYLERKG